MNPFHFFRPPPGNALAQARLLPCLLLASLTVLTAPPASAVMDMGNVPGSPAFISPPVISGNGKVVGVAAFDFPNHRLYLWRPAQGFSPLLSPPGGDLNEIAGLSADGSAAAGTGNLRNGGNAMRAFHWSAASGFTDLGLLDGNFSIASGISADGNVVVGTADDASGRFHAFRWTAGIMQELASLEANGQSEANDISGNGKITVGGAFSASDPVEQAVMWDEAGTISRLGVTGAATATNVDGSVTVGVGTQLKGPDYAFRWTAATGAQNLGTLGGSSSRANDVNADGSVVVGGAKQADGADRAFRWSEATGMTNLGVLSGTTSSVATSVSDDGNTVVGTSDQRAFIWTRNPGGDGAMQDLENLELSQIISADTLGRLTAAQNRRMRDLNQQQCIPSATQRYCLSSGLSSYRGVAGGDSSQWVGHLNTGLRLDERFAVGASLYLGRADLHSEHARQDHAYGLALWGTYQQHADAQGWVASASVGTGHSDNRFERGVDLADVQRAQARTAMHSTGVRVAVDYGLPVGKSLVTPEVALSHTRTQSDGFTERHAAFPLTLEAASSNETYATLGVRSETPLSAKTTLQLGVAVDALLDDNTDAIEGRSAVPGMGRFQLHSGLDKRGWVPMANAQLSYALSPNASVGAQVQVGASTYAQQSAVYGVGVQLRYAF